MDEQTLSLIPASEEDLQYLNPEPQSINLVPASQEDLQYITPVLQQPTMLDMTADFETFKAFRKAGAFDSQKSAGEMITDSISGIASDLGQWAKTLPLRLASNFADDKYSFVRKEKAKAKATTLQILGNLELDYKALGAGISRGVDKLFGDSESEEDLKSSYEFFKTQAELEHQRQGKAAQMVAEGFLGMSPEFLTLGMPEEQREMIRTQKVMPDMEAARGGTIPTDPMNFLPLGAAFRAASGTGRATLTGAEKILINETLQLAKLQDDMTRAIARVGDNTVKSRRLAIKQAPARARLEKGLAEVTEKIAENKVKLKPLAAKRDMALTDLTSKLPANHPLKEFLNEALKDVPVKQPLNLLNKAGGATLIGLAKPVEFLGNALQFIKTLPQETAINMLMKAGEKAGVEVTEQQANLLIKSGVVGGVGYGGYQFSEQFTDSEVGKLGGALSFLLGPQFLSRFGRNTAILGREIMKPTSDMVFFSRLASKDAEKLTTQLIDRTAILPVSSVARKVTGAAEGKVMSRMAGNEAFGNMSQGGQAAVNFLDRTGLGRYVETAGRLAKGAGVGGAVGGAFGLAASGGGDMPEAIYGGIGTGMLLGSAGALGAEVVGFSGPINHMEARYGDWMHYTENYLPANQKEAFNKLNRDVQMAVANKIVANPSLSIEYVSNGKNAEGGYFDRVTGDIVINTDSPRAIEPLLAHEFTHYLEQTGGKRKFIDLLIGNPITGKPGIFVQRVTKENQSKYPDLKVGDPIMVGEGANRKFLLSDEFEQARTEYGKKLQDTLLDSEGNKMTDADLAKIMTDEQTVSEIVAEHGTDFLLNDPRRYRDKRRGTIGKIMGGILDTELVQNIPLLRQTIAMMGGTFRPDGRLITDNKLFSNLKKYPQITELVRKYNREIEGMSPQRKESLEQKGDIQGREIKSSGRSTKEVVVDIKSTELAKSPQLAELLRAGTLLQIDKDGNVIPNLAMTAREQGKYNRSFAEKLKEAVEEKEKNEGLPEGHVRPEVNPKTGNIRFVGRYLDDSVIDKLEKSGNWNKDQIQTLRDVNSNIRNKGGNEYLMTYFKAAGQGGGRYVNAKVENHIEVPYGFEITQKNNIILRTVSVNQLVKNIDQLARQQQGELTRLYGADIAQAKVKLLQDLDQYHRNHADGLPGRTGLDANQDIAKSKADFINSAFGTGTKDQADSNPWRQSLGKKNPRDVYRSRRIERIGKMEQLSGTRFIDYDKINKAFIPKAIIEPRGIETGFSTENIKAPNFVSEVLGDLKVDVQRTKYEKPEINLADHYGKNILMTMADRTPTAHTIYGVNDVQFKTPLRLGGGRDYMFDDKGSPGAVWANEKGAMSAMLNRKKDLGDQDMLVIPFEMAPTSVDFPTMAPALHIRYAQVAMKPKDKKYVSKLVRSGGGGYLTKSQDPVKVPSFDIDMENIDKFLGGLSGPQRKTINNVFDMVNRPSPEQKKKGVRQIDGALSNFEMRAAISDPDMFNQSSLMQTNNVGLITGGNTKSFHDTYNAAMQGKGLGVLKVPASFQPTMQDFLPDIFKKSNRDYVHANDAYTARMGVRTTKIDDALLKRLGY